MNSPVIGALDDHLWFIDDSALARLRPYLEARATDPQKLTMRGPRTTAAPNAQYSVNGNVGSLSVMGPLFAERSPLLDFFGIAHTSYPEIRGALAEANADPAVERIEMYIDSPGGQVKGFFPTAEAIARSAKPVEAIAETATSAAYGLGSAAASLKATGPGSTFGSVGVAVSYLVSDEVVTVTSSNAPDKIPDVRTESGKAVVRDQLDQIHDLFVSGIAQGRGVTTQEVNANFGRGRMMLAAEATRRGMIDGIRTTGAPGAPDNNKPTAVEPARKSMIMDVSQLKAEHPAVYESVLEAGRREERDRCVAHLTMAEASGEFAVAQEAIADGSRVTDLIRARHFSAEMKKRDRETRALAENEAATALDGAKKPEETIDPQAAAEQEFIEAMKELRAESDGRTF
jgi:ClpP class serine protease